MEGKTDFEKGIEFQKEKSRQALFDSMVRLRFNKTYMLGAEYIIRWEDVENELMPLISKKQN